MKLELPRVRIHLISAAMSSNRLVLINRHPGPEEENVLVNNTIALSIVCLEEERVDFNATRIWVNGTPAFDSGILPDFYGIRAGYVWSADSLRITLDPLVPFESESTIEVRVETVTIGGAYALEETYRFYIEDRTEPILIGVQAVSSKTVHIEFNEDVRVIDPTGFVFNAQSSPAVPISPATATAAGAVVEVVTDTEMTPLVPYEVIVTGIEDLNGNPAISPTNSGTFTGFKPPVPARRRFQLWEMSRRRGQALHIAIKT